MRILKSTHPNIITVLSSKVESTARLPLEISKGSAKQRSQLADYYSKKMEEGLERISDTKRCKVDDFLGLINEIVSPAKIDININPLKNPWRFFSYKGGSINVNSEYYNKINKIGSVVIDSTLERIKGYDINLPLSKDNKVINNKFFAFHEARHLFDYICNPKIIDSKTLKIADSDEKIEAYKKIHKIFLSDVNLFGKIKENVGEELKIFSDDEAISCLQNIRHALKSEINAYSDTINYMKKYPLTNYFSIYGSNEFLMFRDYPKRLKIANEMLKERLQVARELQHKKLSD